MIYSLSQKDEVLSIGHRASGIGRRASGVGHRASGIGHTSLFENRYTLMVLRFDRTFAQSYLQGISIDHTCTAIEYDRAPPH